MIITGAALVLSINVIGSIFKRWVYPKYGKFGVQVMIFSFSLLAALYFMYKELIPGLENFIITALTIFSSTVTIYEVALQYFPAFKVNTPEVVEAREEDRMM